MRHSRSLRSRLFFWFLGAIGLAMMASSVVVMATRSEASGAPETMARNLALHLSEYWDDDRATHSYLREIFDVTGFEAHLVRNPESLPLHVRRLATRGAAIAPDGWQRVFVPVVRGGVLAGALDIERFGGSSRPMAWWRFVLALLPVVLVLSAMAGAVANQLARPLERLAQAADRFGGGDLKARTELAGSARRWVAREVRDVAVRFNRMADRLEAMVQGQRELLAAISHEIRSPLGRARIALEIARDRLSPDAGGRSPAASLDDIDTQLTAIDSILGDLLDLTRTGLADLRRQSRSLVDWVRERVALEPSTPLINVVAAQAAGDVLASFDGALLGRAFHNLLTNARAHGHPPELPIEVRIELSLRRATVCVRDRGPGWKPGFADRAFEPFVRGDVSRSRPQEGAGYGLGLAIVRRIVEAHGGRVFARNAEGGGAEVGFDLPLSSGPL